MQSWKASMIVAVVLLCLPFFALGQQPPTSITPDPMGRFLGAWELHMKQGAGVPERESLTFERTESGIKITHLVAFDNGTILDYWGVMDPKGDFVQMHEVNGKPMNEEWRIVSVSADALIIEDRPFPEKKKYQLSPDGRIMKMSRLAATMVGYPPLPDLTFQKSN